MPRPHRFFAPSRLALALLLTLPILVHAEESTTEDASQDSAGGGPVSDLDRIVVTATLTERLLKDVPATVTAIDRARMDRELARDLRDLFRYEPGVTVTSSFGRFGLGDIRIRGLGGNRVRIETDGIPVSDAFAIGSFSNANRNFVDLDTLKQVEVVRGPGSALYGSDALGGVVAFATKDPADYLGDGRTNYAGFRLGYQGENDGLYGSATAAFAGERWSGLAVVGHRQGQETDNQGERRTGDSTRTSPNPQNTDGRSLLAKLVFAPGEGQRFKLAVDANEDQADTDVLTSRGAATAMPGAPQVRVLSLLGDDHQARARVSLAHEIDGIAGRWADSLRWQVYRQDSETTQRTAEERLTLVGGMAVNPTRREREFNFDQRVIGAEAVLHRDFTVGSVDHAVTYGFEAARTELRQKRDGRAVNLITGASTQTISPDVFPVRDFPISTTTSAAVYVQDEIRFADGAVQLVPALRVDRYELKSEMDAIFAADNPGVAVSELGETSVSPKLGVVWHFSGNASLFGGYQHGFRAPPYNDVNLGFTNLQFGYTAIPNPALKPETSDGLELGLRYAGSAWQVEVTTYYTRYDDFIESQRFIGFNPQGLMVFQSRNVADAQIHGAEARGRIDIGSYAAALSGWSLRGAAAWSKGEDRTTRAPLASIDPLRATLGLAYERDRWGVELAGRFAARGDDLPQAGQFETPGYGVLDLLMHWAFAPGAELNAGVFNLGDRKYWEAGNVPGGVLASSTVVDRYTSPGRNIGVSLAVSW